MSYEPEDTASPATLIGLLREFRADRDKFHVFDDYDASMARMRTTVSEQIEKLRDPLKSVASRLFMVTDRGFFLLHVAEWKIDYLAEALIHAIEVNNPIALANNTRGVVEHIAAMVAVLRELETLETTLRGKSDERAIDRLLMKAEGFLHRAYYGTSPKTTAEKANQALHIDDCLKVLKCEIPDAGEMYGFLCEYVHPNYGSNVLVSSGRLAEGRLNPPPDFHRETLDRIRRHCARCMLFLRDRRVQHASVFVRLQGLIDLCFAFGATLNNAFSKRSSRPAGGGNSQATAYWFPRARTPQEAIQLSHEFLQTSGYKVFGQRIGGIGEGVIYDIYETDRGTVRFKVPMIRV